MRIDDVWLNYDENNDVGEVDWAFAVVFCWGMALSGWRKLLKSRGRKKNILIPP